MLVVSNLIRPGLAPVSFTLAPGECLAVQGPSGAGKTLLLRALADLDPSEGAVSFEGTDRNMISGPAWRRLVGYLPAEPGWWSDYVGDHFEDWTAARELVLRLGLPADADRWPVQQPSTGERMRLALVRTLVRRPRVLLLDEPTAALDPASVAIVEQIVAEGLGQGLSVVWVSHDPAQVTRVAHRVLQIVKGAAREAAA